MEENIKLIAEVKDPRIPPEYFEEKWTDLITILNSCGVGPQKSIKDWQTVRNIWINKSLVNKIHFRHLQIGNMLYLRHKARKIKRTLGPLAEVPKTVNLFLSSKKEL